MSIASELGRLQQAKADLETSIEAKGVNVPAGTLLDAYPALVDTIPAGTDTSDATATADSLLYGHTAYGADGTKLTGAGAYWQYVKRFAFNNMDDLPEMLEIYAPNSYLINDTLTSATGVKHAIFTFDETNTTGRAQIYNCKSIESITYNGSFRLATDFRYFANGATALTSILGTPLNLSAAASAFETSGCSSLVTISFESSTIKRDISFASSPLLSTTSLLSIANGLDAGSAPKTLTMHATSKTNMDNINVDVVDGVAILGTTKTLMQFVNTDKGWTVA